MLRKISWDEYYMGQAFVVAQKSRDPSSMVGSVIVTKDNKPLSQGYNGFPKGCDESQYTWERPLKYNLIIHAEMNARLFIDNRNDLKGAKIYVTHHPCDNCLKHLIQDGISEIIYSDDKILERFSGDSLNAIKIMTSANDILLRQFYYNELDLIDRLNEFKNFNSGNAKV